MTDRRHVVQLGAGLVGGAMAVDLARDAGFRVTVVDRSSEALERLRVRNLGIETRRADLSVAGSVRDAVADADLVLSAVPGFLGYATMAEILEAGRPVVDISFLAEDPFELDALAKEKGVPAIVDCGVAPGMSHVLVGYGDHLLDEIHRAVIYVGGLPEVRRPPWEYKAVFSPIDVIEEYTRPARLVEGARQVVRPALSELELLDFPGVGTLEAFNSDGLRTLARTVDCPDMKEKTLRYPGHVEKILLLREMGLLSSEEVDVGGARVRPIDLTSRLLFRDWKLEEGEADLTLMQVVVEGALDGRRVRITWDLLDRYDPETRTHSMARTTGYTATMALRLLAGGHYAEPGISPPEYLGRRPDCVETLLAGLAARGVVYRERRDSSVGGRAPA